MPNHEKVIIAIDDASTTSAVALVPSASAELATLLERTRATIDGAMPLNTRRAYEGDLRRFAAWCSSMGLTPIPLGAVQEQVVQERAS